MQSDETVINASGEIVMNTISSTMPASAIITILTKRGRCPDITDQLDLVKCGPAPTSGGGFGDVYQGALDRGDRVAVKCARFFVQEDDGSARKALKRAARELYVWSSFKHENVLRLLGLARFRSQIAMVAPWMEGGTLLQYIERNLSANRHRLCIDISAGVAYLHRNNAVHGDIKSDNVLVSGAGVAKVADFGCTELKTSTLCFTTTTTSKPGFSIRWAAPEILGGSGGTADCVTRSKEADLYALGMTLLEVVTGKIPFHTIKSNMAVCVAVFKKEVPERPAHMPSFEIDEADRLWELMRNLWEFDPVNRPSSRIVRDTIKYIKPNTTELCFQGYTNPSSNATRSSRPSPPRYTPRRRLHPVRAGNPANSKESSSLSTEPVPQSMGRMSEAEQKLLTTERDHVRELEYMRDYWIIPLRDEKIIPEEHRSDFVRKVFCNLEDVIGVHTLLCDRLTKWQKAYPTGETIGDIFLDLVPHFAPLVQYGEHWPHGKYVFEKERESNPEFKKFVESVERLHMSRRLELNGYYLTKPMMRLAQYPMLLEMVLKNMSEGDADRATLLKAIGLIRELIAKLEQGTAGAENRLSLLRLKRMLVFKQGDEMDLELERQERQLIYKGSMKKRGGAADESGDLQLVLLDHVLLVVKSRVVDKREQLIAVQQPIPLELLVLSAPEENTTRMSKPRMMTFTWGNSGETTDASTTPTSTSSKPGLQKDGHQLALCRLGKRGCPLTLWASTVVARRKWVEHIMAQQKANRERNTVFDTSVLREDVLVDENKVNCVVPYDMGRRVAYGTDIGVFVQALGDGKSRTPAKVLDLPDVQQIDVLEECQLLVILSGRSVLIFPLDVLESPNSELVMKRMTRVSSYASFFKIGHCLGRAFLCIARANSSSSVIKLLELIDHTTWGKKIPTFKELLQNGNYTLKVFKEFYLPTECHSVHFLKTKLCVACKKGLETVDLKTLDTQVLDPADTSLDFMQRREDVCPLSIYPIDGEFLLCYTECAFYVGQTGRRSKRDVTIYWEGTPTAFALHYPYIIAFNPTFIEIRRVEDGSLAQVIRGNNLRCLFTDTQPFAANSLASNCPSYPYTNLNSTYLDSRKPAHALMLPRGRDDIMFVSDNKVMALRPAIPLPHALDELGTKV